MSNTRIVAQIRDVADLLRGVTYKKEDSSSEPAPGLIPLLRATNINGDLDFAALVYVPASCVSEDQYLSPGDSVIAASSGSLSVVGKSATLRHEWYGTFGAFCYVLRPASAYVAPFYLSYFLQTSEYRSQVSRLAAGVNINNLKRQHLEELKIPLVSMAEQHSIVEAIESYFTRLDDAVATLERVQRNLKRYRASVLKAAVEGRLVPTEAELARSEGRDYEPASILLERILAERRRRWEEAELAKMQAKGKPPKDDKWKAKYKNPASPKTTELPELPEGWVWATAEALSDETRSITYGVVKLGSVTPGGVPTLRSSNVRHLRLNLDYVKQITKRISDGYQRTVLRGGEVLVTVRGTLGGIVATPPTCVGFNISREVARIALVDPRLASLVATFIASDALQNWIMRHTRGIAYTGINIGTLKQLPIPLPPLTEQSRIVQAVEQNLSVAGATEASAIANARRCHFLRQSILRWAFEGRIVDQDPTDEPASRLLERIQAERESANGRARRSPRRPSARLPKA